MLRLIAITDPTVGLDEHVAAYGAIAKSIGKKALAVQLRLRGSSARAVLGWAHAFRSALPDVTLFVNDRLDVARALGGDVHLGGVSVAIADARSIVGPRARITVACHDDDDLLRAREGGAFAGLFSPVFAAPGKGPARGLEALARAVAIAAPMPVYALGGIDAENAPSAIAAGASGVASIRGALDPNARWRLLRRRDHRLRCASP